MTPVIQTKTGRDGNCFAACVASVLDIPEELDAITSALAGDGDWTEQELQFSAWCAQRGLISIPFLPWHERCVGFMRGVICIASGRGPRGRQHAVVWRDGMLHDPHPDGGGLICGPDAFTVVAKRLGE